MRAVEETEVMRQVVLTNSYKLQLGTEETPQERLERIQAEIGALSGAELIERARRREMGWNIEKYGDFRWLRAPLSLEKLGFWPGMKGLPPEFTRGNVTATALAYLNSRKNGGDHEVSIKIEGIRENLAFTAANFLPVVLPGHVIRKRDSNAQRMEGDIWDGNTRCLTYLLEGRLGVEAYAAVRQ